MRSFKGWSNVKPDVVQACHGDGQSFQGVPIIPKQTPFPAPRPPSPAPRPRQCQHLRFNITKNSGAQRSWRKQAIPRVTLWVQPLPKMQATPIQTQAIPKVLLRMLLRQGMTRRLWIPMQKQAIPKVLPRRVLRQGWSCPWSEKHDFRINWNSPI